MSNYAFLGKKVSKTWKWGKGRAEYPFIIILKNCLTGLRKDNLGKYSFFFFWLANYYSLHSRLADFCSVEKKTQNICFLLPWRMLPSFVSNLAMLF